MQSERRSYLPVVLGLAALIIVGIVYLRLQRHGLSPRDAAQQAQPGCALVNRAFREHLSGEWLTLTAQVTRVLPDQHGGFTHQRFIVRCRSGQTIEVVNDVDIGTRAPVIIGDRVSVRGIYVWNPEGGLVHYTHHTDTLVGHGGWILLNGRLYADGPSGSPLSAESSWPLTSRSSPTCSTPTWCNARA